MRPARAMPTAPLLPSSHSAPAIPAMSVDFSDVPPRTPSSDRPPAPPTLRHSGWQLATKLHCPAHHLITRRDTFLTGTLIARCDCGRALLAVAAADLLTSVAPATSLVYTIEITKAEAAWIQRARPSLHEVLDQAGLLLAGGKALDPGDA